MKRTMTLSMLMLAGMLLMLAGCQETLSPKVKKGDSILVRVASRNGALTKTVYSGKTYTEGNTTYERIDWVSGDKIRLFSTNTDEVATTDGKAFFDYTIDQVSNNDPADRYSNATLYVPENQQNYGLIWVNEPSATTTVYGIYPPKDEKGEEQESVTNSGQLSGFVGLNIPVTGPASGDGAMLTWTTQNNVTLGTPNADYMKHAYMVSAPSKFMTTSDDENWTGKPYVNLDFYPIFNSFEIELVGERDSEFPVNWVSLSNEVESGTNSYSALTGDYRFNYKGRTGNFPFPPTGENITQTGNKGHTVQVNLPANTMLSSTKSVKFTILTLPPTSSDKLTNLVVTVNYGNSGNTKTKSLKLNKNVRYNNQGERIDEGNPIQFPAFQKARIKCQALDGGEKWMLDIYTDVDKWTVYEKSTSFSQQIGCDQFKDPADPTKSLMVQGMWETKNHYADEAGVVNGHTGYEKYYQIRTLKDDYFIVKFRPYAPVGGYWRVRPWFISGDTASPDKFEILVFEEGDTPGQGTYSSDLTGQIMGNWVTLHIRPKNYDPQEDDGVYVILLHCDFGTTRNFVEGTYLSADSEFQDVHGDGRYSYWRFTLDKSYTGGN